MTGTIRLLIADDHPVVRDGLRGIFEADGEFEVAGEAANGREAVDRAAALRPDVVLMDLRMPELDGVSAIRALAQRGVSARVLVLTTFDTDTDVLPAIEAGATGYLLKDSPPEELRRGVRAAARGEAVLSPSVATRLVGQVREPDPGAAEPARARHPGPDRPRLLEPGGRRAPVHQRGHGQDPRAAHLRQARRQRPRGRRRGRLRARPATPILRPRDLGKRGTRQHGPPLAGSRGRRHDPFRINGLS